MSTTMTDQSEPTDVAGGVTEAPVFADAKILAVRVRPCPDCDGSGECSIVDDDDNEVVVECDECEGLGAWPDVVETIRVALVEQQARGVEMATRELHCKPSDVHALRALAERIRKGQL